MRSEWTRCGGFFKTWRRALLIVGGAASVALAGSAQAAAQGSSATLGPKVGVTLTTSDLRHALTAMPGLQFSSAAPTARVIHVNPAVQYQRIIGFGGTMTDSAAWLIYDQLSGGARATLERELFGRNGINLNFIRVPMGSSDYSVTRKPYTYDDLPRGQTDPKLRHFSIAHDRRYIIPELRAMLAVNRTVRIIANPWTPPPWMKANDTFGDAGGKGTLLASDYEPLANYFVKFIQAYKSSGVPIWAITPQNEPGSYAHFPALNLSGPEEARFVKVNLAPALRQANLDPWIYGLDRGAVLPEALALVHDPVISQLAGIAWHCYGGQLVMDQLHNAAPSVQQIISECAPGIIPYRAAEATIAGLRNWGSAELLWSLALDPRGGPVEPINGCPGCTGLATISEETHKVRLGLNYYELGQISRFVNRSAVRIASDRWVSDYRDNSTGHYGVTPGLDNVTFLNPSGTTVLVAYNNSTVTQKFSVEWNKLYFNYTLPAEGTVTFTW